MLSGEIYQVIFDEISEYLPNFWEKLIVYLEHGQESYSYSFYVKENGKYIKCFDLKEISEDKMYASFARIEKIVSEERKKFCKEVWSNLTMVVNSDGKMKMDFDYTDLSLGNYEYKKNWKEKYLQ